MPVIPFRGHVLSPGATATTLYLSDLQFEHLGKRGFTHNPLIKKRLPVADRNVIATQTAALFVDELLRQVKKDYEKGLLAIEIKGDVADTPLRSEIARLEKIILNRQNIPVEGFARGNHDSENLYGVVNLSSPHYELVRKFPLVGRFSLDDQLEGTEGDPGEILTQKATMEAMHRIVNGHREGGIPGPGKIATSVHAADYDGYQLLKSKKKTAFSAENLQKNFRAFWKRSKGTKMGLNRETQFWECIVNYDIADEKQKSRTTDVNPFYIQAAEVCRFRVSDGTDYPVYTISIDGLDHVNLVAATGAGISELQVRLIEIFMDQMLKENPRARFKFSCHFSAEDLAKTKLLFPWRRRRGKKAREAFRRLLSREEVILYSFGHTHSRGVTDLNKSLKLKRKTPLMEINVPSLIDYHPALHEESDEHQGARALVVEKLRFEENPDGARQLAIDLEFRGLDRRHIQEGRTAEVEERLRAFAEEHGYIRARETVKMLRNRHLLGWLYNHSKRFFEFLWFGVFSFFPLLRWGRCLEYWKKFSITQYLIDNFTVVSTVNMFNEAYHLMSFLESVAHFIKEDDEPGQLAIKGQIEGLLTALRKEYIPRRHQFEEALSSGRRPAELKQYNDLFSRTKAYRLSELLMMLKEGSEARAFAILAGIDASREEFFHDKRKPTKVAGKVPAIIIPLER